MIEFADTIAVQQVCVIYRQSVQSLWCRPVLRRAKADLGDGCFTIQGTAQDLGIVKPHKKLVSAIWWQSQHSGTPSPSGALLMVLERSGMPTKSGGLHAIRHAVAYRQAGCKKEEAHTASDLQSGVCYSMIPSSLYMHAPQADIAPLSEGKQTCLLQPGTTLVTYTGSNCADKGHCYPFSRPELQVQVHQGHSPRPEADAACIDIHVLHAIHISCSLVMQAKCIRGYITAAALLSTTAQEEVRPPLPLARQEHDS